VIASSPGDPDVLEIIDVQDPVPGPDELLVRVHATALNRADLMQREGRYPPPPGAGEILGLEMAGVVAEIGKAVHGFVVGDRVCAVLAAGGYAEFVAVQAEHALPIPAALNWEEAAAIPEVFTTAWDNVFTRAELRAGERLLIHGGSSGVGTAAIQLARRAGAAVAVTASSSEKLEACRRLGAEQLIDYTTDAFLDRILDWTDGDGVDVVLDMVGGDYLDDNLSALAMEGRLIIIGLQQGATAELDLAKLMTRRLRVMGSTLRARSDMDKAVVAQSVRAHVLPGFDDGELHPVIDQVFAFEQISKAHQALEDGGHIGKIVVRIA
jgi:putative PIG3 family NAD(P)H quinone oxidoreductase